MEGISNREMTEIRPSVCNFFFFNPVMSTSAWLVLGRGAQSAAFKVQILAAKAKLPIGERGALEGTHHCRKARLLHFEVQSRC